MVTQMWVNDNNIITDCQFQCLIQIVHYLIIAFSVGSSAPDVNYNVLSGSGKGIESLPFIDIARN